MKTVTVNNSIVKINNMNETDELTPSVVRSALRVKYGNTRQSGVVHDGAKAYRVSPSTIRKMSTAEEVDYFGDVL